MADILQGLPIAYRAKLWPFLKTKPVRTASGVAVVAVMSKPHRCPHIAYTGNVCVYCPGGPDSDFEYSTQAYTGYEPTSMRAIRARYDPFSQVKGRVTQLRAIGHEVDKVVRPFVSYYSDLRLWVELFACVVSNYFCAHFLFFLFVML